MEDSTKAGRSPRGSGQDVQIVSGVGRRGREPFEPASFPTVDPTFLPVLGGNERFQYQPPESRLPVAPCPFRGTAIRDDDQEGDEASWLQVNEIAGPLFNIECFGCGIEGRYFDMEGEAIAAWNTRVGL